MGLKVYDQKAKIIMRNIVYVSKFWSLQSKIMGQCYTWIYYKNVPILQCLPSAVQLEPNVVILDK